MAFTRKRYGEGALQLYVQAYTATFTTTEALRTLVEPLLDRVPFVSLSLGTRPDCLPSRMLDMLEEWGKRLDLWVELGVQTSQDNTLERINRRHTWAQSREAVERLAARGIQVCGHLLFGLPGETADDMFETLERMTALPVSGLKFHNLHVLKGTPLGEEWERHRFEVLREEVWLELAAQLIRRTPAELPLFRLFTDSPSNERLAPPETFSKGRFLTELAGLMRERGWQQGMNSVRTEKVNG
jgi:radical SAM protein (TIGR01212 family)